MFSVAIDNVEAHFWPLPVYLAAIDHQESQLASFNKPKVELTWLVRLDKWLDKLQLLNNLLRYSIIYP